MNKLIFLLTCLGINFNLMALPEGVKPEKIHKVQIKDIISSLTKLKGTVPAHWRVTWTGDPSKEAKISWTTADQGKSHVVYYGTKPAKGNLQNYQYKQVTHRNGLYTRDENREDIPLAEGGFYHHANLKNLKAGTRYYFTLKSDNNLSREFYFITAPKNVDEYYFLNGGDSRSGHQNRCRMNLRMTHLMEENPKIIGLAHGGDYCNHGTTWKDFRVWLSHNELLTASDGRVMPIVPTRGNHEAKNALYGDVFDVDYFHSVKFPLATNIIVLDSNGTKGVTTETSLWPEKSQGAWFKKEIANLGPKSRWLMTMYHAPIYPAVKGRNKIVGAWEKLFGQYQVDLAMEADGHCIKVTKPMRDGKEHPDGTIYIGEGGLGVGSRGPKKKPYIEKKGRGSHVFLIHVTKQNMKVTCVLMDGKIWHEFDIKPKSHTGK